MPSYQTLLGPMLAASWPTYLFCCLVQVVTDAGLSDQFQDAAFSLVTPSKCASPTLPAPDQPNPACTSPADTHARHANCTDKFLKFYDRLKRGLVKRFHQADADTHPTDPGDYDGSDLRLPNFDVWRSAVTFLQKQQWMLLTGKASWIRARLGMRARQLGGYIDLTFLAPMLACRHPYAPCQLMGS